MARRRRSVNPCTRPNTPLVVIPHVDTHTTDDRNEKCRFCQPKSACTYTYTPHESGDGSNLTIYYLLQNRAIITEYNSCQHFAQTNTHINKLYSLYTKHIYELLTNVIYSVFGTSTPANFYTHTQFDYFIS